MCNETSENKYKNVIGALKKSPMFNLSLSSKELFHSNFLYWIAQKDKAVFKTLINKLGVKTGEWPDEWEVSREHKNFDLCVCEKVTKNELLVIENKFKSLPDKAQLDKYDKKLQNNTDCQKILLSLTKPFIDEQGNWKWKSYEPLVNKLREVKDEFDPYAQSLIEDYCGFVNNIITLTRMWIAKDKQDGAPFLLDYKADDLKHEEESESNVNIDNKWRYYNDAKELRIHDLYGKYRTERLRVVLDKRIKKLLEKAKGKGLDIATNTAYTRSLPILEVVIRGVGKPAESNKEPEAFFISIQDNQYRHAINARDNNESTKEDRIESSKTRIKDNTAWHSFLNPEEKPKKDCGWFPNSVILANSGQRNNVCSFAGKGGVNYIYQYKKIEADAKIEQVLDLMVDDVEKIIDNFTQK